MTTDQGIAADLDAGSIYEMGAAVLGDDASLGKIVLILLRRGVGEGALEPNELRPVDRQARRANALALHPMTPIHEFRDAHKHFLRVTPPQFAGAPERARVNYGHAPPGLTACARHRPGCRAGSDHNYINRCRHNFPPAWCP